MTFQERPYQTDAGTALVTEYDKGVRRMLYVMATGTGKTICFARAYDLMKSRLPGQMLVLAHTEELVDQNLEKIQAVNPNITVGKEMAGEYSDPNVDVISASVATLGRAGTKRLEKFNVEKIDKVIVDEAHHATAESYQRVLNWSGCRKPDTNKLLLGVTATPNRTGESLDTVFEKVAYVYSLRQAIQDGWLVEIRGYRVTTDTSLDGLEKTHGDYASGVLAETVNTPGRNRQIVNAWKKKGENRQTLAFCVDISHAKKLCEEFTTAGVDAEAIWGDDPDRTEKLRLHREGKIKVLCNCSVLLEGYDDPSIACIILARPTLSHILFTQMVGRGTRLQPTFGNLKLYGPIDPAISVKKDLIVLDIVDSTIHNSLVTLPTLMGLPNVLGLDGQEITSAAALLEAAQVENPTIDFSKLESLDDIKTLIQSVNMFEIRFPKEVEQNSDLIWFRAIDGGYKMIVPKTGVVRIKENLLSQWEITGDLNDQEFHGVRGSFEEAIKIADEQIRKRASNMAMQCILREATWHNKPVTKNQKTMLGRLFPHKVFSWENMNSGQASKIIAERLSKRAK